MPKWKSESGRLAVIWLATAFVIVIGAGASAFVIFAGTDEVQWPMIIWGLCIAGLVIALISLSLRWDRPMGLLQTWLLSQNRDDPTDAYRAARRRIKLHEKNGGNEPPSVESVRDAADHGGAWVPRSNKSASERTDRRS